MAPYIVYRRSKATGKMSSAGEYATKKEAMEAVKEARKYQKEYAWTYQNTRPWTA